MIEVGQHFDSTHSPCSIPIWVRVTDTACCRYDRAATRLDRSPGYALAIYLSDHTDQPTAQAS